MGLIEDKVVETGKNHYNDPIKTFDLNQIHAYCFLLSILSEDTRKY